MADSGSTRFGDSSVIELTGKIMVVAIILLFFIIVFVFCLHLYIKWFWHRRNEDPENHRRPRRRLDVAGGHQETIVLRGALDARVLKTLPITVYDPIEFKDGLECAVCLNEVSEGEKTRLLPKCNHGFHVECIDMWFQSHSTCPICRNSVANQSKSPDSSASDSALEAELRTPSGENSDASGLSTEGPNFPTNVLFWGDETQLRTFGPCLEEVHQGRPTDEPASSSSSTGSTTNRPGRVMVIDISRHAGDDEEQKSPVPTRFRTLKRLLSGNRRVNPPSPKPLDVEQGGGQS